MDGLMRQRKFMLACFFAGSGTIGFFMGMMDATQYNFLAGTVLGLYGAANVMQRKVEAE